jgi:ubiquinone/menaquinone biosynthesis C-methylase UbiE
MRTDETLKQKIHDANVSVHRSEAKYYEQLHPEVYSKQEQKRIVERLKMIDALIADNRKNALDVGAGTGNLTGKLLQMSYKVTAIDISPEMCAILQKKYARSVASGKLTVVNQPIENLSFETGKFDLITLYSVLHHLPNYVGALENLSVLLKKGGVIYIDHEASPYYWKREANGLRSLIKDIYFHSNPMINSLYFQVTGLKVPLIDYSFSDYWHKKEHSLSHMAIRKLFEEEKFQFSQRTDYYETSTWVPNPLSIIYRLTCAPEMSLWIAKK